jgi:hypothetical protein
MRRYMILSILIFIAFLVDVGASDENLPTIILHIGPEKTGDTYIHHALFGMPEDLAAIGVRYMTSEKPHFAHHFLQQPQVYAERSTELFNEVKNMKEKFGIISSEQMSNLRIEDIEYIRSHLQEFSKVKVVLFFRPSYMRVISSFKQRIRARVTHPTFKRFIAMNPDSVEDYMKTLYGNSFPGGWSQDSCFDQLVDRWISVFGRDNVVVIDYENTMEHGDILNGVLEAASAPTLASLSRKHEEGKLELIGQSDSLMLPYDQMHLLYVRELVRRYQCPDTTLVWTVGSAIVKLIMEEFQHEVPLKGYAVESLKNISISYDHAIYEKYSDIIFNSNVEGSREHTLSAPSMLTLDSASLEKTSKWSAFVEKLHAMFECNA